MGIAPGHAHTRVCQRTAYNTRTFFLKLLCYMHTSVHNGILCTLTVGGTAACGHRSACVSRAQPQNGSPEERGRTCPQPCAHAIRLGHRCLTQDTNHIAQASPRERSFFVLHFVSLLW